MASESTHMFTCISCSIAFPSAEKQRDHYRSDHHRYNMKRRVAGLPPISVTLFNQRVLERKAETAITTTPKSMTCELCNKAYTSENGYRAHLQSKKHKERELKGPAPKPAAGSVQLHVAQIQDLTIEEEAEQSSSKDVEIKDADAEEDEEDYTQSIDAKIAAARARLSSLDCLFCAHKSPSFNENISHMSVAHSFFVPDADYLTDLPGLIAYLGEKIAVGNVCIYCNEKGRAFRSAEAVRKHMLDKGHCKIAYDSQKDRMELADYYDFTSSYPEGSSGKKASKKRLAIEGAPVEEDEEWEDVSDEDGEGGEDMEVVDEDASSQEEDLEEDQLTYGDSPYELVLPSGARIGHRSMRRYYAQSFHPVGDKKEEDPNTGAALVRRLLADKNSELVPVKGGFGAFGAGGQVVKARNRGEAREAGRHVREFRDMRRREEFKTRMGFVGNNQKHFRDPLLQ